MFGQLGEWDASGGEVRNLGVVDVTITGSGGYVGGLVGSNIGETTNSYATGSIRGKHSVGGLVGGNGFVFNMWGAACRITNCYSSGVVTGETDVGGFLGAIALGETHNCFWDTQASGQATSAGGTGKTTAEMQTAKTFLEAGWDFVGETANGTEEIWWINEGKDYPKLWWELGKPREN